MYMYMMFTNSSSDNSIKFEIDKRFIHGRGI